MTNASEDFSQRVAKIRARFMEGVPARLNAIRDVVHCAESTDPHETQLRKAHRLLHDMAGSAAMLDLPEIEGAVRRALDIAESADAKNTPFDHADLLIIDTALSEILAAVAPDPSRS
ncbi:Hpt domain-containing protein [Pseudooceanicola aestuarii]|uniref:Hpt domain-containing protein n=1 Tax=Pseudooceanicola aestuarii TaxID=2697319 RepID=UPI0013D82FE4|nr:Hpt domain-containing protein [Pseudooceanicola aestuarii]